MKTRDLTAAAQPVRYGLGWRFVSSGPTMEHDGDAIGARTLFVRYLDASLTIIILSNQTRLDVEALRTKLADAFL